MTFPGDVLFGPLIRAVFGPPKPRREPARAPDDRHYGGPSMPFAGWPHSRRVSDGCPDWLALALGLGGVLFLGWLMLSAESR